MDPLSLMPLVVPVLRICLFSLRSAKKIWDAPRELQDLFQEIVQLIAFVNSLSSLSGVDAHPLEPVLTRLQDAQRLFEERLSKPQSNAKPRFRRRSWLKHHGRIQQVTRDVSGVRKDLTATMLLMNLSSVTAMQNDHNNMLSQIREHEQAISALTQIRNLHNLDRDSNQRQNEDFDHLLDAASQYSEDVAEALQFLTPCDALSVSDYSLETSRTFYPEKYVMEGPSYERLAVFSMSVVLRTATARVDKYFVMFAKDARHWNRVTVTAKVPSGFPEVSSTSFAYSYHTLPGQIGPRLEEVMRNADLYDSVTNVRIVVQPNKKGVFAFDPKACQITEDATEALNSKKSISQYFEEVERRGLPQYLESEVVVLGKRLASEYVVLVESQQCIEMKIPFSDTSGKGEIDKQLADMKLLLMAQGCPGVPRFVGVVLKDDRTHVCSYLVEFRGQRNLFKVLEEYQMQNRPISWERRQKWIRQVITTIAEVHRRGSFIGCLDYSWVGVDSEDNIQIDHFKSTGGHLKNRNGSLAPEFRQTTAPGAQAFGEAMTFQSDLFDLGLLIWNLVESHQTPLYMFCAKSGCKTFPRYRCTADHTHPIQLPVCTGDVPAYINTIIGHCRQEQPSQRKSAAALLEMLPPDSGPSESTQDQATLSSEGSPTANNLAHLTVSCDACSQLATDEHYHCSVCSQGDFDLCSSCVANGVSCFDAAHKLSRRVCRDGKLINFEPLADAEPSI